MDNSPDFDELERLYKAGVLFSTMTDVTGLSEAEITTWAKETGIYARGLERADWRRLVRRGVLPPAVKSGPIYTYHKSLARKALDRDEEEGLLTAAQLPRVVKAIGQTRRKEPYTVEEIRKMLSKSA